MKGKTKKQKVYRKRGMLKSKQNEEIKEDREERGKKGKK